MSKSPQDVLRQIKDEGIELIDLKFTDLHGKWLLFFGVPTAAALTTKLAAMRQGRRSMEFEPSHSSVSHCVQHRAQAVSLEAVRVLYP